MKNIIQFNIGKTKIGHCRYGWMIYNGPYIGKCFELYGEYSESEVAVFKAYLKLGDFSIDVGANIGDLTLPMSSIVGESGKVFAYESHPEVFNTLCANLALNNIKNTKPINAFVAENPNADVASEVWGKFAYIGDTWDPVFTPLDNLNLSRLDFIKIDVDGNELSVIRSGIKLIKEFHPVIYFENDLIEKSSDLLDYLIKLDYTIFFHPAPIFQTENHYNNPDNHWSPKNVISLMMLAVPTGKPMPQGLRQVTKATDWWT